MFACMYKDTGSHESFYDYWELVWIFLFSFLLSACCFVHVLTLLPKKYKPRLFPPKYNVLHHSNKNVSFMCVLWIGLEKMRMDHAHDTLCANILVGVYKNTPFLSILLTVIHLSKLKPEIDKVILSGIAYHASRDMSEVVDDFDRTSRTHFHPPHIILATRRWVETVW